MSSRSRGGRPSTSGSTSRQRRQASSSRTQRGSSRVDDLDILDDGARRSVNRRGSGTTSDDGSSDDGSSDDGSSDESTPDESQLPQEAARLDLDARERDRGDPARVSQRSPAVSDEFDEAQDAMLRYDNVPVELAEALRGIVNRHELRTGEPLPQTISVTSALAGEGATTVSQALAALLARESSRFVCWIDCSWIAADGPSGDVSSRPSLLDLLEDRTTIVSAFRSSPDLPQLMSLSPGPVPETKRNMIVRSPEFEHLLELIRKEFDHVIFDVPPVLANAAGLALLRRSNASMLVVQHKATSMNQVERVVEAVRPTPILAVVLNRYRTRIPRRLRRQLGG